MNYLKKIIYGDVQFTVNSIGLETDFSELRDPVAFLIVLKVAKYQQKNRDIYKKNLIGI